MEFLTEQNELKKVIIIKKLIYKEIKKPCLNFKKEYNLYEDINITVELKNVKGIDKYGAGLLILNSKSELVTALNTVRMEKYLNKDITKVKFKIKRNCLNEDKYYVTVSICDEKIMFSYDKAEYATSFNVNVPKNSFGVPLSEGIYAADYEVIEE